MASADDASNVKDTTSDESSIVDSALARRVVRKIDWRLMPLLFITYNLNFMDKTILSSASVFGLKTSTGLHGTQYSWVSSVFYFGYLFWEYPTSVLIQRLPVGKYVGINTFFWGTVVALTAACTNYGGLITVRFLLGVAEATISPAFLFITSSWYTRAETPTRVGIWFSGNSLGGVFANFIAFGLGHVEGPGEMKAWQWLFIVLGVATFLWGIPLLLLLPDSIASAKFLTPEEKEYALRRVELEGTGKTKHEWKVSQVIELIMDPKTYFFFGISLLTQIPNGGTQNFGNLVLKGFGFTSLQSTLIILPSSFICFFAILGTGRLAGRFHNIATYLIIAIVLSPVVGSAIIYSTGPSRGVKLFGYYLLSPGPGVIPLAMSLVGVNFKGSTKKLSMTAVLFLAYCAGNIAGPQFFKEAEAPHYPTAFRAILICYALVIALTVGLRAYLVWENRRRDVREGANVHVGEVVEMPKGTDVDEEDEETTDWNTPGFRYRM
ncbi:MFS general substrate transporter [Cylindrobasidium torrendii FP15055 ss-10]|uniref:MFS general substrate transporter n=1 Tax=Cylindrobasidium torrendii FP15055 ss-10 TaxID=1314674 RepID=A0A0D7B9C5_9AGAR|nr:MFS general substrate transporter [Cylindrobasidium torrendii FP15055 ss-10]